MRRRDHGDLSARSGSKETHHRPLFQASSLNPTRQCESEWSGECPVLPSPITLRISVSAGQESKKIRDGINEERSREMKEWKKLPAR